MRELHVAQMKLSLQEVGIEWKSLEIQSPDKVINHYLKFRRPTYSPQSKNRGDDCDLGIRI